MSLINEALKRSESDKRRNSSPYFDNLTVMRPDDDDEVPPPPRPTFKTRRREKPPVSRLLILGLVAMVAFGGWYVWSRSSGQVGPHEASADAPTEPDKPPTVEQMRAAAERIAPDPTLNRHNTDSRGGENTGDRARLAGDKTQDPFTAAMRQLESAKKRAAETSELSPMESEPLTSGGKPIKFRRARAPEGSKPQDVNWPASARMNPIEPKAPPTTAPVEKTAPVETPDPPAAPAPDTDVAKRAPTPAAPHKASKLRVTAIMRGPDGNVAIINGGLYRKGQTVKGATIVKIGQYEVELVADGKRFTIRI